MTRVVKILVMGIIALIFLPGCKHVNEFPNKEDLIKTDEAFSKLSETKGMKHAFLEYAAEDVVMLKKNNLPLVGKESLRISYQNFTDTGFILSWKPLYADIAASGEIGYTYGIYFMTNKNSKGDITQNKGTYVSVWKKDNNGEWKYVLDSGNEGLGEQD